MLLASAVAVVHGAAILFMLTGALVALRRPRLLLVHAPLALAIASVNVAGADCPLTDLELWLRDQAGAGPYTGGFLGHYLFAPIGIEVSAPATQIGIYTVALSANALGYGLVAVRAVHGSVSRRQLS